MLEMIGRQVSAGALTTPEKTLSEGGSVHDVCPNKKPGRNNCKVIFRTDVFIRIFTGLGKPFSILSPPTFCN